MPLDGSDGPRLREAERMAAEAEARRTADLEDDDKRKGQGPSVADDNPAKAELGANIRPDVVAAPGGLVTVTTQKSSTYEAFPDRADDTALFLNDRDEWSKPTPVAEPAKPELTLALIEDNPRNAVELPLPRDASPWLVEAAQIATDYQARMNGLLMNAARDGEHLRYWDAGAEVQPDAHEFNESEWFKAAGKSEALAVLVEQDRHIERLMSYPEESRVGFALQDEVAQMAEYPRPLDQAIEALWRGQGQTVWDDTTFAEVIDKALEDRASFIEVINSGNVAERLAERDPETLRMYAAEQEPPRVNDQSRDQSDTKPTGNAEADYVKDLLTRAEASAATRDGNDHGNEIAADKSHTAITKAKPYHGPDV